MKENIDGIGSVHGGVYESIAVDGMGKLRGKAKADTVTVDGMFKVKGALKAETMEVNGFVRAFRYMKVRELKVDGMLKLRRARLEAESINCKINADQFQLEGGCSIAKLYGDHVMIKSNPDHAVKTNGPFKLGPLMVLYFGRRVSMSHPIIDLIECTSLEASGVEAKIIRANEVRLRNHCAVESLYCDGAIDMDSTCTVKKIFAKNGEINREANNMANMTLVKILDLYKDGKISADEAETMLKAAAPAVTPEVETLPWEEDGKLRIVAYIGRKLHQWGHGGEASATVTYTGGALNVECCGNLQCGEIEGSVNAGGSISAGDIKGNVNCGGGVTCTEIHGNATAGGGVSIKR